MLTTERILQALRNIMETDGSTDIVSAGRISGVTAKGGAVGFVLSLAPQEIHHSTALEAACEREVRALDGVESVTIVSTASEAPSRAAPARKSEWNAEKLPGVKRIIAVASGKGGVGKSTTAVNLAHALAKRRLRVGLLDADIYGPSLPRMMGMNEKPQSSDGRIIPLTAHGIAFLSMGLMMNEAQAVVWRGPQATRALAQMLRGTAWGPLDILLIDMPPGTGDVHLSLVQQVPVNGALIVTTPQDVAVADARKAIDMFRKVYVNVLGIVENMSGFTDGTGKTHAIFGEGGGAKLAEECKVKLLGSVPLDMGLREAGDAGTRYEGKQNLYDAIAAQL